MFWSRISEIFRDLEAWYKTFVQYSWTAMEWMASQIYFDASNALSSLSPEYISTYNVRYWKKYESPWSVDPLVYSIPTLQDMIFADPLDITIFEEDVDYSIVNSVIVWTSLGPTDGNMDATGTASWTQIGTPSVFAKDTSEQYEGTRCLKITGVSGDGAKSTAVAVTAEDWVRFSLFAKGGVDYTLELFDESNGASIGTVDHSSESDYDEQAELILQTPDGCTSVTLRVTLSGTGTLYVDLVDLTRYTERGVVFAEEVLMYNSYLDTKTGYDLRFKGINDGGYSPAHAKQIMRALNYAYRMSDLDRWSLRAGTSAILGLPFAYYPGTVKSKATASGTHSVVITKTADSTDYTIEIDATLCELTDLPDVGTVVEAFEPLYADALKVSEVGEPAFIPKTDLNYPTDGDMEAVGTTNYTTINGAVLAKDSAEQHSGTKCLKVTTNAADEGFKPAANKSVTAGEEYFAELYIKRGAGEGTIVRADIIDVTNAATITSAWFGDEDYERGMIPFTAPAGCLNVRVEFIVIQDGVFYVDGLKFYHIEEIKAYWADKTTDSAQAGLTIAAAGRAGSEDLVFTASDHIYGTDGHYIEVVIAASGTDQGLSSTISGSGVSGDPYIYTITTGNNSAEQNSNNAIRDFVNSDPHAIGIIVCSSNDDATADPTYALVQTALSGGVDVEVSIYSDTPFIQGDTVSIRNMTNGTIETRKVRTVAVGSGLYTEKVTLDDDLFAAYESPEVGTSTSVGIGSLADTAKTWAVNEFATKVLIDADDNRWTISSNTANILTVTGGIDSVGGTVTTPATGAYRIVQDHVVIEYGNMDAEYVNGVVVYNRAPVTFVEANMDAFIQNVGDRGHALTFVDVS